MNVDIFFSFTEQNISLHFSGNLMNKHQFDTLESKFVQVAIEAINQLGRPMASSEIEVFIRGKYPNLLMKMPPDYARIILSMESPGIFTKYKSNAPIRGVDRRAVFFGLSSKEYPSDKFRFAEGKAKQKGSQVTTPSEECSTPNGDNAFQGKKSEESSVVESPMDNKFNASFREVSSFEASTAWQFITENIQYTDPIWKEILKGIQTIDQEASKGSCSSNMVSTIINSSDLIKESQFLSYIIIIFSREVIVKNNITL